MMADRFTKRDAQRCFERLAKLLGKQHTKCFVRVDEKVKAVKGCWYLDYQTIHGGAVIEEIDSERGTISHPFGMTRRKPREFCDSVSFAEQALGHRGRR